MGRRKRDPDPVKRSDGRWSARYYDQFGQRRDAYGATAEGAIEERKRKQRRYDKEQTVGEFLDWWQRVWLERLRRKGRSYNTIRLYRSYTRNHLITGLDPKRRLPLPELAPQHIEDLYDGLERTHAPATINGIHEALHRALGVAVRDRLVDVNVAALVEPPAGRRSKVESLEPDEAKAFVRAVSGVDCGPDHYCTKYEALWLVALALGLRLSEALAIAVDVIDLDAGTLDVRRHLLRDKDAGRWLIGDTKSHATEVFELPAFALDALKRRLGALDLERQYAGSLWKPEPLFDHDTDERVRGVELVFVRADGGPLSHQTVRYALDRVCERHGSPRLTPHVLRHSCASLLIAQGADLVDVQKLLRHRSQSITSDLYTHMVRKVQRDHARRMHDLITGDE